MKFDKSFAPKLAPLSSGSLAGKTVIVVGGTGGLGRTLSLALARADARVIVVGRTFRDAEVEGLEFVKADLSSMKEAQKVAVALPAERADYLIFTTGIFAASKRQTTDEGIERDMAVSFLNRLVMLREMGPRLGRDAGGHRPRVFVMGFPGSGQTGAYDDLNAEREYKGMPVHMNTVAGNEMLVLDGATRYPHLDIFGLNPGLVKTDIRSNMLGDGSFQHRLVEMLIGFFSPTPEKFAEDLAPLLVSADLAGRSGSHFDRKARLVLPSPGLNSTHIKNFLTASAALIARTGVKIKD